MDSADNELRHIDEEIEMVNWELKAEFPVSKESLYGRKTDHHYRNVTDFSRGFCFTLKQWISISYGFQ